MGRRGQGYGSEDHFICYRSNYPERLDLYINPLLPVRYKDGLDWLYPTDETTEEPRDLSFMPLTDQQLRSWYEFWPKRGNRSWDGIARCNDEWLLFEAKANAGELCSPGTGASAKSLRQITAALDEVKRYIGAPPEALWHHAYYQYANRIAALYFLNVVAKIPARLIFLHFTGDVFPGGRPCPQDEHEWRLCISQCHSALMLPEVHPLSDRMHEIFVPALGK